MKNENDKIPPELLKRIKRIELKAGVLVADVSSGGYSSVFKGQGIEFQEVREYIPGDDVRKIDWNVTARHGVPYIKRYKEERELNVLMLLDLSGSLKYGSGLKLKKDILLETAAILSFTGLFNQDKIGAVFFTNEIEEYIPPTKNKNSILRLIRDILFYKPKGLLTDINGAFDFTLKTMKRKGVIFLFSDFFSEIDSSKLYILSRKHDLIPVIINDVFEFSEINVGLVDAIDNENGKRMLIDTSSASYKKMIRNRIEKREAILQEFKKNNITPLIINTNENTEKAIISYFEKRKKIRK
ncbi:MAG: hypothetical protein A2015_06945 [Spirochaetes bacterium GWF1_31_7]|nr:MAG: hypothetical protein A2Y30_09515 [Spirochaetes bacterium GWE1_32_154]OHD46566.1 MAG: hypothetical protein A2015_06945 [Spirochaetes bacterium GWF1_31_7]OHD49375.1 MAG: hypothetical protein A2Y29_03940 [Spirochaetes bacterium GWE2_31_10]OHD79054.1 MAG: hypothetical protein A2355_15570 [Spirochaetes bacterium RIFOXYB1_FULL_32_8]HBD93117.1 DUF58 domain-containing protein [Spirochaetia bacterium]